MATSKTVPSPTLGTSIVGTAAVKSYPEARRLVIVPGHAVYVGTEPFHSKLDKFWIGGFPGEASYYTDHARAGAVETANGKQFILLFSGGQTREAAGPISEGQSYWSLANQNNWFNKSDIKERAFTEDFARDSLENMAFGVGRFAQITGRKPEEIIVCGWAFKEERYRMHAEALGIRQDSLHYVGVNNPEGDALVGAMKGEVKTRADFAAIPLGNEGILAQKRAQRDPFIRSDAAYRYYNVQELFNLTRLDSIRE